MSSRRGYHGWRIVGVLAITETVSWGVLYYSFAVLQVPMRAELGLSSATVAGAWSLAVLVAGVCAVPVGRWLDRHGARGLMTAGSVLAVLLVLAWSRVQTATGLYLVFAGIGVVSAAVLYDPAFAVVVRWFTADRARALLAVTVVAGFASTIFLPLSEALVDALGWRQAVVVLAGVLGATTVLPHALVLRRDPADLGLRPDGLPADGAGAGERAGARAGPAPGEAGSDPAARIRRQPDRSPAAPPSQRRLADTAAGALADRRFRLLTAAFTANALAVVVVAVHLVSYLRESGHPAMLAAVATGSLGALSVTGRLLVTVAARGRPVAHPVTVAFAAQAAGAGVLLLAGGTVAGVVVFVVLFGLGFGVGTIARPAMLAAAYGTTSFATLSALLGVALTGARTVGPVGAGMLRTGTGSYTLVLLGLVGACALAALATARAAATPAATPAAEPAGTDQPKRPEM